MRGEEGWEVGPCNREDEGEKHEVQLLHLTLDWENRLKPKINFQIFIIL